MSRLVPPHGSETLNPLLVPEIERAEELRRARGLKKVPMTSRETSDSSCWHGRLYAARRFHGEADWHGVLRSTCARRRPVLADPDHALRRPRNSADRSPSAKRSPWSMARSARSWRCCEVDEKYAIDKAFECLQVFRTTDPAHPGVQKVMEQAAGQSRRPGARPVRGRFPAKYQRPVSCGRRKPARCSPRRAGPRSPPSRPATRCTAAMSTWPRSPIEVCDGVLDPSGAGQAQAGRHSRRDPHQGDRRHGRRTISCRAR